MSSLEEDNNSNSYIKQEITPKYLGDKKSDENQLSNGLIKSAQRTGQLSLSNRGLGSVPDKLWKIEELVLDETKDIDFGRSDSNNWWNTEPLKSLDLSSNVIKIISPDIKFLQHLVTLKLHDNALTSLPPEIGELKVLSNLSLDHNKLSVLPKQFYQLRWLSISHNELKKIEPDFGDLVMLNFLNLSHNKLTALPPGMGYLVRLVELNLSHNQLCELPPDIVNLRDLKKMNLSNNNLKRLPALGELRKMEILDANHNDIEELPDVYGCTALKEIYLANNFIKEITEEFCDQMQHLTVLNVRDNKIEILPENICLLKTLKRLDLTNNSLNKLPRNLGLLTQLQSINMEGNKLSFVRQDVISGGTDRMMKFLRDRIAEELIEETKVTNSEWPDKYTLKKSQALMLPAKGLQSVPGEVFAAAAAAEVHIVDLSRNKLTEVPSGVFKMRETLSQLMLSSISLSSIPADIRCCVHLQYLDLSKNCLTDLNYIIYPNILLSSAFHLRPYHVYLSVFQVRETLSQLMLSSNSLTSIPADIRCCVHLQYLDLSKNCLADLPMDLGHLKNLRELVISNNKFPKIPRCVYDLEKLEILLAAENKIEEINVSSDALARLPRLAVLDLANNSIGSVPPELGNFTHLRSLELMGNCFRQPRHAVLAKGTASVLSYLRDRIPT